MFLIALALSVAAASPSLAAQTIIMTTAHGIVDWNSSTPFLSQGSAGISRVVRLADGEIEVGFSDPRYQSLQSTVVVACRRALPCFIAWDTYANDSVRVRVWDQAGTPAPSGSFSIALIRTRVPGGAGAAAEPRAGESGGTH
jgi:hypothetical protein